MAKIKLKGNMWYSDVTIRGNRIRDPLSIYRPIAQRTLNEMVEMARMQRRGKTPENLSWVLFKEKYLEYSVKKNSKSLYFIHRMFEAVDSLLTIRALREMTPEQLVKLNFEMIKKNYAPVMVTRLAREVKTAMSYAERIKYVPMQDWSILKLTDPEGRLDFYEFSAYYELLKKLQGTPWFTSAYLMGRAGLRLSEMHFLEWADIQFPFRRLYLKSKNHLNWRLKGDRKGNKFRIIPLTLEYSLEAHLKSIARPAGFVLGEDRLSTPDCFGRQLAGALEATGIKTYLGEYGTAHTLRHTFGSHLAQKGVSLTQIRDWMGHSTTRMTEVYAHLMPGNPDNFSFNTNVDFLSTFQTPSVSNSQLQQYTAELGSGDLTPKIDENGL